MGFQSRARRGWLELPPAREAVVAEFRKTEIRCDEPVPGSASTGLKAGLMFFFPDLTDPENRIWLPRETELLSHYCTMYRLGWGKGTREKALGQGWRERPHDDALPSGFF